MKETADIKPNIIRQKKCRGEYYKKILVSVFTALMLITTLVTLLMISIANVSIRNYNCRVDSIILNHMQSTTQYLYEKSERVCMQIYASSLSREMLYGKMPHSGNDYSELSKKMSGIVTLLVDGDDYIDSFNIYSSVSGRTYSSKHGLNYRDLPLEEYIKKLTIETNRPWLRSIIGNNVNIEKKVITFFFGDYNKDGSVYNGVFVNVNVSWLKRKLSTLYSENQLHDSCEFLMDGNGQLITAVGDENFITEDDLKLVHEDYTSNGAGSLKRIKINNKNYYVSTIPLGNTQGMYIVRVQDPKVVNAPIYAYLKTALLIIIISILASIVLAWIITRNIYSPIESLTEKVSRLPVTDILHKDEIELLNRVCDSVNDMQDDLGAAKKKLVLYELFSDMSEELADIDEISSLNNLKINPYEPLTLVQISVDNDDKYDQRGYADTIAENVFEEFSVEMVSMDILNLICIVQTPSEKDRKRLIDKFEVFCDTQLQWQSYAIIVGDRINDLTQLPEAYAILRNIKSRRFFYSERAVLTGSNVTKFGGVDAWKNLSVVFDAEEKLLELVSIGAEPEKIQHALGEYISLFSNYDYTDVGVFRSHLIQSVYNLTEKINSVRSVKVLPDIRELDNRILRAGTISQAADVILPFMVELSNELKTDRENKYEDIVKVIKDIVEKEYSDVSLCLVSISDRVNFSPNYVGRMFKAREGMSVSAYITDVRLEHAAKLIEDGNLRMNLIIEQVGFSNESCFYKNFKKKYMVTPKDYMVNKKKA